MVFKGASGEERIKILDFGISHVHEERTELDQHYEEALGTRLTAHGTVAWKTSRPIG